MTKPILASVALCLTLGALASAAEAQAPRITPRGDPSVRNDTIYALAVDPADHPEETSIWLLDDGVLRLEADGRGTKTYRSVMQILRPEAVDGYNEMRFSWAPGHQKFTLNWARVVKPDGTVISAKPTQVQISDVPAQRGNPVYADTKVMRISLSGVAPGTIVDYSTTTEELKPFLPGDGLSNWGITTALTVIRSRYIVDLPANVTPLIEETNLEQPRTEKTVGRRKIYTWTGQNIPRVKTEQFAADSNGVWQSIAWALPMTWQKIGAWYADHARGRYAATPALNARLDSLLGGAGITTLSDTLRAIHKYVAQDVRYVSVALGIGGYQPRTPDEVMSTGFGDCKDKATIFVAMLNRIGLEAYPVLLNSTGGVNEDLPSLTQFDHAIAAYKRPGDTDWRYTDLTADLAPLDELPFGEQGEFGIIVKPDGAVEEITFPLSRVADNQNVVRFVGEVDTTGLVHGVYEEYATGHLQYRLRDAFANPFDSVQTEKFRDALASGWFKGATGTELETLTGKDLTADVRVSVRVNGGQGITSAGRSAMLPLPIPNMSNLGGLIRELENAGPRRFPISAQSIFGYGETLAELKLTLPEGWEAQLPESVELATDFGRYRKVYRQEGRVLTVERFAGGGTQVIAPERVGELIEFLKGMMKDDAAVLVIVR